MGPRPGHLDVGLREHELADGGVEREHLHARAEREAEEGRGRVEAVARGDERGALVRVRVGFG